MRKYIIILFLIVGLQISCGVGQQAKQLKAFENCNFKLVTLDSLVIAGSDITSALRGEPINLNQLSGVALGLITRDIPLEGLFTVEIKNEGQKVAALNQFEYEILVDQKPFTQGNFNQAIRVSPGDTQSVQVPIRAEIYKFLKQDGMLNQLQRFLIGIKSGPETQISFQFKVKPIIKIGSENLKYPSFITFEKTIKNTDIL